MDEQRRELEELNDALENLARIFPDVKIEVFRELLVRFDGESQLHVCVEQLLRHKEEWVAGRWRNGEGNNNDDEDEDGQAQAVLAVAFDDEEKMVVPPEERFRTRQYKTCVRTVLCREFNYSLSKSVVDAVLAEVNFSYARARPILQDLSRRTWRATLHSIIPFKRKKIREDAEQHPLLIWQLVTATSPADGSGQLIPQVKSTGCRELDQELHASLVAPLIMQRREEQEGRDFQLAEELNESEAKRADALYECECCLGDITFERISTCSTGSHVICYHCIRRTVHEALFGQGWNRSVHTERSTLKCIAPMPNGSMCDGSLQPDIVKRAILLDKAGRETYRKFEDRLASDTLLKSRLKLIRCPFCSYAEVDSVYHPSPRGVSWRLRRTSIISTTVMIVLLLDIIPLFIVPLIIFALLDATSISAVLQTSLRNLCLKVRRKRFMCANPSCRRVSCIICQKQWRDPHVCHEPLLLDLRATIETARTAAVKRTCPRCGLSFVKSSGCNKLTCICGYSMCYLCRKGLGPPLLRRGQQVKRDDDEEEEEEEMPEGYKHFCEHFRVNPGSRCTECNKCDLYESVDEEAVARGAGEKAEREWLIRQGTVPTGLVTGGHVNSDITVALNNGNHGNRGDNGNNNINRSVLAWGQVNLAVFATFLFTGRNWRYWLCEVWKEGRWREEGQALVDWAFEQLVIIDKV